MADLSHRIKRSTAAKWTRDLVADLLPGETIWAFFAAVRFRPATEATIVTNIRIVGFNTYAGSSDKRLVLTAWSHEIRDFSFPAAGRRRTLLVTTPTGDIDFGVLDAREIDFAVYYIKQLRQFATTAPVSTGSPHTGTGSTVVVGPALPAHWWSAIGRHARNGEQPWLVINAEAGGRLAALSDRIVATKSNTLTGAAAGGREAVFLYSEIVGVEYSGGPAHGVLEILTPSYPGNFNRPLQLRESAKDPSTITNCLPLTHDAYLRAAPQLDELRRKIAAAKVNTGATQSNPAPVAAARAPRSSGPATSAPDSPTPSDGLVGELERLVDMRQRGFLDEEEFKAAKAAAIAKSTPARPVDAVGPPSSSDMSGGKINLLKPPQ